MAVEFKVDCFFNSKIAVLLDIPEALILSRIQYFVKKNQEKKEEERFFIGGEWWMCETGPGFVSTFPFLSLRTVRKAIKILRDEGFIKAIDGSYKGSRANFYTVNEAEVVQKLHHDSAETAPPGFAVVQKLHHDSAETALSLSIQESSRVEKEKKSKRKREGGGISALSNSIPLKSPKYDSEDLAIAKLWLEYATKEMKWRQLPSGWTEIGFAEALVKIQAKTDLNHSGLRAVLNFVSKDDFWVRNALSPADLLKTSKNGVRKIDNILSQMHTKKERHLEDVKTWAPITEFELNNPFG